MAHEEPPLHAVFAGCGTTLSINHTGLALACASIVPLAFLPHSTTSATSSTRRCDFSKAKGPSSGFLSTSAAVVRAHDSVAAAWARKRSMPRFPATPLMECACVLIAVSLCGNQPVNQVILAISAPRPCFQLKLGHDLREIHSTDWSEQHLTQTARDPKLKHKLNFDFLTGDDRVLDDGLPKFGHEVRALLLSV